MKMKRHNQAKIHPKNNILFLILDMPILCEHFHRLEFWQSFKFCGNVESVPNVPFIRFSRIFFLDMHGRN